MSFDDSIFGPATPPHGLPPPPPSHWLPPTPPSHGLLPTPPPPSGYCGFTAHDTNQGHRNPGFGLGNCCCSQRIGHNYEYFGQGIEKNDVLNKYHGMEIQRHLEKERIREEIIAGELAWRRVLNAEVREELRMERELALRLKGGNVFDISRVPVGKSFLQEAQELSLEERIAICVEERLRVRGVFETSGVDSLPFQQMSVESKVKEAGMPKERIIFVPKPGAEPAGTAKQVLSPAKEIANKVVHSVGSTQEKKVWACVSCQVCTTSEHALNEHFQGKKHKSKEAAMETSQPVSTTTPVPCPPQEPKINQSKPLSLHIVCTKDSDENSVSNLPKYEEKDRIVLKIEEKKSFTYWCEMCNVRAEHEKLKEAHLKGKRHLKMLQKCANIGLGVSPKVTLQPVSTTTPVPTPPQGLKINQSEPLPLHIVCTKDSDENGASNLPKIEDKDREGLEIKEKKSMKFLCEMCNVRAEHKKVKEAHLNGKKHLKMLKLFRENESIKFWCEMCKVRAEHEKVKEAHLKGKKHLKKLKWTPQTQSVMVQKSTEKSTKKERYRQIRPQNSQEERSIMSALQLVLKKSRAHGGLARGFHECAKAIENDAARLCVLAEDCDLDYIKLVKALCADHSVSLISVPSCITLGDWAGMCDIDDEGNARNVVACSIVVVKDYGEESKGLNIFQEYVKSHSTHSLSKGGPLKSAY